MILLIDFKKAFEIVSNVSLFKVLSRFNSGNSFKKWIKVVYSNAYASVMVNKQLTSRFHIERGCRQGYPLSPYLFLICVNNNNKNVTYKALTTEVSKRYTHKID